MYLECSLKVALSLSNISYARTCFGKGEEKGEITKTKRKIAQTIRIASAVLLIVHLPAPLILLG